MLPFLFIYYYLFNFIQNFVLIAIFLYFMLNLFSEKRIIKADEVTKFYVGLIAGGIVISFFVNLASNVILNNIQLGTAYLLIAIDIGLAIFKFLTVRENDTMKKKNKIFSIKRPVLSKKQFEFYVTFIIAIILGFLIDIAASFVYEGLKEDSPFKPFITSHTKLFIGSLILLFVVIIAFLIFRKLRRDKVI